MSVGAGFDDAKITSVPGIGSSFIVGQPLNGVPKFTASLMSSYTVPTAVGDSFVRAQYSFTGRSISYNNDPLGRERSPYSLVDVHVGLNRGPLEASLFAKNLLDKRANLGDEQSEVAEIPGRPRWLVAQPRTIGVELSYAFKEL